MLDSLKNSVNSGVDSVLDFINTSKTSISDNVVRTYNNIIKVVKNKTAVISESTQRILDMIKSPKISETTSIDLVDSRAILYINYLDIAQIPIGMILDDYREYMDELTVDADVSKKFFYSPSSFANHIYGTPELDYLVLYVARMQSLFDFKKPKVKIIPKENLKVVNDIMIMNKDKVYQSRVAPKAFLL